MVKHTPSQTEARPDRSVTGACDVSGGSVHDAFDGGDSKRFRWWLWGCLVGWVECVGDIPIINASIWCYTCARTGAHGVYVGN